MSYLKKIVFLFMLISSYSFASDSYISNIKKMLPMKLSDEIIYFDISKYGNIITHSYMVVSVYDANALKEPICAEGVCFSASEALSGIYKDMIKQSLCQNSYIVDNSVKNNFIYKYVYYSSDKKHITDFMINPKIECF